MAGMKMHNHGCTVPEIGIIGPYPPPHGGISINVERTSKLLDKYGYLYHIYDIYSHELIDTPKISRINNPYIWFLKYLFVSKEKIIHL